MIEVERKAWVGNPAELESRVRKFARLTKTVRMVDYYFAPMGHPDPIGNCFRIRVEKKKSWITFKKKKIVRRGEVNEETNLAVRDPLFLAGLLEEVGFEMFIRKEKRARMYRSPRHPGVAIELHRVAGLGSFIEIEVLCRRKGEVSRALRRIDVVFRELKIFSRDIETKLYIELLRERMGDRKYRFRRRARSLDRAYP